MRIPDILLGLLRAALLGEKFDKEVLQALTSEEWKLFVSLAQQHNIVPLVCDGLAGARDVIPPKVFSQIVGLTVISEDKYAARKRVVESLGRLFAEHNIPFMVLKGYGISLYYPNPSHRTFSDVDMYSFGQYQEADRVLHEKLGIGIDDDVHHHTTCVYEGVLIENHYDIINTVQHNSNAFFEQILKAEAANDSRNVQVGNAIIMLPSAMFNALFLMRHMASHYAAERVSLRHLCDWMLFIKSEHKNVDWERVCALYEEFNMKRFADAIAGICIDHLGMSEEFIPNVHRDKNLETRILQDIIFAEFDEEKPQSGVVRIVWWKTRRYFANRWKHKLVYNESWVKTFFQAAYAHLLKPKTITH